MEVIYQSDHGNLAISRPTYIGRSFEGKCEMKGTINFIDGFLKLDDKKDEEIIDILDGHRGNKANGGTSFRKMKSDILGWKAIEEGKTFATPPDEGVSEEDINTFEYLNKLPASLPTNTFNKALRLAIDIYERYEMVGVVKPHANFKQKRLRACIIEMIATIEERGIWNDDIHREKDTGSSSEKD